jgi:Ala-tRNA(Pro) deacylase
MPPASPQHLFARLDALGIAYVTHQHRPIFTVEEGADLKAALPGGHSKNLFLKEKKKDRLYLLSALGEAKIDLNAVSKLLGVGRFSFGNADLLMQHLGVTPGSVTAFALMNDPERNVTFLMDEGFFAHDPINFHPMRNDATTAVSPPDFLKFIRSLGREPIRLAFDENGKPTRIESSAAPAHVLPEQRTTS